MRYLKKESKYAARRRRNRLWRGIVTGIAAVVVFCTTYALILPAITMETQELSCGLTEHTHNDDCYQIICGQREYFSHTHIDECYQNDELVCTLTERVCHHHGPDCYSKPQSICGQEEAPAHAHTEQCYSLQSVLVCGEAGCDPHTHGSECYTIEQVPCNLEEGEDHTHSADCIQERRVLTCALTETQGHTHGQECYQEQNVLTCGQQETQGHTHTQDCYPADFKPELICGQEDIPEHRHSDDCRLLVCELEEHTHSELCVDNHQEFLDNLDQIVPDRKDQDQNQENPEEEANDQLVQILPDDEVQPGDDPGVMPLENGDSAALPVVSIYGSGTTYDPGKDNYSTNLTINFQFNAVTDEKAVTAGKVYTYTYPKGIVLPNDLLDENKQPRTLYDGNGIRAGTYRYVKNEDGTYSVQVTFSDTYVNETVQNSQPVTGHVSFEGEFSKEQYQDGKFVIGDGQTSVTIDAGKVTYPSDTTDKYNIDVSKEGSWERVGDKLVYSVYVRTYKGTPDPINFKDIMTIPSGLSLGQADVTIEKGTAVYTQNWDKTWSYSNQSEWSKVEGITPTTNSGGVLEMSLPALTAHTDSSNASQIIGDVYKITYSYPITDQTEAVVEPDNAVSVTATGNGQTVSDNAEKTVTVSKDFSYTVDKSGAIASDKPGYIKWTVTVNRNGQNLASAVLTDAMLSLVKDATDISTDPADAQINRGENGIITDITFPADGNGVNNNTYTITYYTPVEESWNDTTKSNTAVLDPDPDKTDDEKSVTANVDVKGVQLGKSGSHNAETNKLDWVITINAGGLDITGATLTDDVFSQLNVDDLTFVPTTGFTIQKDSDGHITGITFNAPEGETNRTTYTVRYSTAVPQSTSSNETPTATNTATLTPASGVDGTPIDAVSEVKVENPSLSKGGSYDSGNQRINWTITVNENGKDIAGAVLTDSMLGEIVSGSLVIKDSNWQEVSPSSGQYTISCDSEGKVTGITFNAIGDTEVNLNKYVVTYSTYHPQEWTDYEVVNDAKLTLEGKDIPAQGKVTVPASGGVEKKVAEATVSEDGKTLTISWTVTLNVPKGGMPGSAIVIDDVTKDQWNRTNQNQWITTEQKEALEQVNMIWTDYNGNTIESKKLSEMTGVAISFTPKEGTEGIYTGFTITLPEGGLIPPEGASRLTFTYSTTSDLQKASIGQNAYYNYVNAADKEASAEYTYAKAGVVKTNGNGSTETTTVSNEGSLTWMINATLGKGNKTITLADTLPSGVTLNSLHLTGWNNLNMTYTVGADGAITETGNSDSYTVSVTYTQPQQTGSGEGEAGSGETGSGQTGSNPGVTVTITPKAEGASFQDNEMFTLLVNCTVVDAKNITEKLELTNYVTMYTDGAEAGSSSQTQEWTYEQAEKKLVDKSAAWDNDNRMLEYSILLNPEGLSLADGADTLTLTDVLRYDQIVDTWMEGVNGLEKASVNVSLVQSSVRLYNARTDEQVTDWTWRYTSEPNPHYQVQMINTITATVPNGVPLRLEYSYLVTSDAKKDYSFNINPGNSAVLEGNSSGETYVSGGVQWRKQSSTAVVSTSAALKIAKVDEDNNGKTLAGAVFTVYGYNMTTGERETEPAWAYTTVGDGLVTILLDKSDTGETGESGESGESGTTPKPPYVTDKLYVAVETKAPDGYILPLEPEEFYFYFSGETETTGMKPAEIEPGAIDLSKNGSSKIVANTKEHTISIRKVDADDNSKTLSGAKFTVYAYDMTTWNRVTTPVQVLTTGDDGLVTISQKRIVTDGVAQYTYTPDVLYVVVETEAPAGYILPEEPVELYFYFSGDPRTTGTKPEEINSSAIDLRSTDSDNTVANTPIHTISIKKVDVDDVSKTLPGAEFSVFSYDMTTMERGTDPIRVFTTDDDGRIAIVQERTQSGQYLYPTDVLCVLVETKAPEGYVLPEEPEELYFYFSGNPRTTGTKPEEINSSAIDLASTTSLDNIVTNSGPTNTIVVNKQWFNSDGSTMSNPSANSIQFELFRAESDNQPTEGVSSFVTFGGEIIQGNSVWKTFDTVSKPGGTQVSFSVTYKWGESTPTFKANDVTLEPKTSTSYWTTPWGGSQLQTTYSYSFTLNSNTVISGFLNTWGSSDWELSTLSFTEPSGEDIAGIIPEGSESLGIYHIFSAKDWTEKISRLPISYENSEGKTKYYVYYVKEITTGYIVSYGNNGIASGTITISNTRSNNPTYQLPATGGIGTTLYTMGGLSMMALAGCSLLYRRSKRRKGGTDC